MPLRRIMNKEGYESTLLYRSGVSSDMYSQDGTLLSPETTQRISEWFLRTFDKHLRADDEAEVLFPPVTREVIGGGFFEYQGNMGLGRLIVKMHPGNIQQVYPQNDYDKKDAIAGTLCIFDMAFSESFLHKYRLNHIMTFLKRYAVDNPKEDLRKTTYPQMLAKADAFFELERVRLAREKEEQEAALQARMRAANLEKLENGWKGLPVNMQQEYKDVFLKYTEATSSEDKNKFSRQLAVMTLQPIEGVDYFLIGKDDKFAYFNLVSGKALNNEALIQSNCVYSYRDDVLRNVSIIVSMRQLEDLTGPYCTIELDHRGKKIMQFEAASIAPWYREPPVEALRAWTDFARDLKLEDFYPAAKRTKNGTYYRADDGGQSFEF